MEGDPAARLFVFVLAAAFVLLASGTFGAWVAQQKRRSGGEGFLLGCLFGPFGILIEALLPAGDED